MGAMPLIIIAFYFHQRYFGIFIWMLQMLKAKPIIISNLFALIKLVLWLCTHRECIKMILYFKIWMLNTNCFIMYQRVHAPCNCFLKPHVEKVKKRKTFYISSQRFLSCSIKQCWFLPPFYVHSSMKFVSLSYILKVGIFSVLAQCQLCADCLLLPKYVSWIL